MALPPEYSPKRRNTDPTPPYRAAHVFANSTEELAALNEFAQSKLYIRPGEDGTLPDIAAGVKYAMSVAPADRAKDERRQLREMEKAKKAQKLQNVEEKPRKASVSQKLKRIISGDRRSLSYNGSTADVV
jgi:hypothetical protein